MCTITRIWHIGSAENEVWNMSHWKIVRIESNKILVALSINQFTIVL